MGGGAKTQAVLEEVPTPRDMKKSPGGCREGNGAVRGQGLQGGGPHAGPGKAEIPHSAPGPACSPQPAAHRQAHRVHTCVHTCAGILNHRHAHTSTWACSAPSGRPGAQRGPQQPHPSGPGWEGSWLPHLPHQAEGRLPGQTPGLGSQGRAGTSHHYPASRLSRACRGPAPHLGALGCQGPWRGGGALTNEGHGLGVDDAAGQQVEVILLPVHHHGVAGVVAALGTETAECPGAPGLGAPTLGGPARPQVHSGSALAPGAWQPPPGCLGWRFCPLGPGRCRLCLDSGWALAWSGAAGSRPCPWNRRRGLAEGPGPACSQGPHCVSPRKWPPQPLILGALL